MFGALLMMSSKHALSTCAPVIEMGQEDPKALMALFLTTQGIILYCSIAASRLSFVLWTDGSYNGTLLTASKLSHSLHVSIYCNVEKPITITKGPLVHACGMVT